LNGRLAASISLWVAVSVVIAWALIRAVGIEGTSPLVPLIAYTPYVGLVAVLLAGLALALRRWTVAALALAAVVALAIIVLPRAFGEPAPESDSPDLTVMTANVRRGDADAGRIVALVEERGVQVLALQELTAVAVRDLREAGVEKRLPNRLFALGGPMAGIGIYSSLPLERPSMSATYPELVRQRRARVALPNEDAVDVVAVHPAAPT